MDCQNNSYILSIGAFDKIDSIVQLGRVETDTNNANTGCFEISKTDVLILHAKGQRMREVDANHDIIGLRL